MAEISSSSQQTSDAEHLKLLSIFHYVLSGMAALFGCFPIFHLILGLFIVIAPEKMGHGNPPPAFMGWFFIAIATLFILAAWTFAVLVLITGRFLALRRHHSFCFVMGAVECLFMPFGTVLGVFTLLVLTRQSVKELFTPRPSI